MFLETYNLLNHEIPSAKIEFRELLSLAAKESYFNGKLYKEVDGISVGSILGLIWNKAFLVYLKKTGYEIVHLTFSHITTSGTLMIFLFFFTAPE